MGLAPERVCRAALVVPSGIVALCVSRLLVEVAATALLYRLRPTHERLLRAARPILTEPYGPAFGPAVRQIGAAYRHLRLDAGLPRTATEEELAGFRGLWRCSPPRRTRSSPPGLSSRGRGRSSPTSPWPSSSKDAATSPRRRRWAG